MKGNIARRASNFAGATFLAANALLASVSAQGLPNFPSTRINPDRNITFRYRDPGAAAVRQPTLSVATDRRTVLGLVDTLRVVQRGPCPIALS
jgi:hypothetical protein